MKAIQREGALEEYLQQCNNQIEEIIYLVRGKLSNMARTTLGALIVMDVHGKSDVHTVIKVTVYWSDLVMLDSVVDCIYSSISISIQYTVYGHTLKLPLSRRPISGHVRLPGTLSIA